jgi:hypothetical protein
MHKSAFDSVLSNRCDSCGDIKTLNKLNDGLCQSCVRDTVAFVAHHPARMPQLKNRDQSPERKPAVASKDKSLSKKYKVSSSSSDEEISIERCEYRNCPHMITIDPNGDLEVRTCKTCRLMYCEHHLSKSRTCWTCEAFEDGWGKTNVDVPLFDVFKAEGIIDSDPGTYTLSLKKFADLLQLSAHDLMVDNLTVSAETKESLGLDISKPDEYVQKLLKSHQYRDYLAHIRTLRYRKELLEKQIDFDLGRPI